MRTLCSSWTGTLVGIDEVNAGASILTRLRRTLVYLLAAVYPVESRNTLPEREREREINKGKNAKSVPALFCIISSAFHHIVFLDSTPGTLI